MALQLIADIVHQRQGDGGNHRVGDSGHQGGGPEHRKQQPQEGGVAENVGEQGHIPDDELRYTGDVVLLGEELPGVVDGVVVHLGGDLVAQHYRQPQGQPCGKQGRQPQPGGGPPAGQGRALPQEVQPAPPQGEGGQGCQAQKQQQQGPVVVWEDLLGEQAAPQGDRPEKTQKSPDQAPGEPGKARKEPSCARFFLFHTCFLSFLGSFGKRDFPPNQTGGSVRPNFSSASCSVSSGVRCSSRRSTGNPECKKAS